MLPFPVDGAALAHQVAARYAAETKPIVTFVATKNFDAHGGPFHLRSFEETAYEEADGTRTRKRVLRAVDEGRTAQPDALAQRSAQAEGPTERFGMRTPLAAGAVDDYTFGKPQADGDTIRVDFTAKVRDGAHGDGTLTVTRDEERPATLVIRPAVLPPKATSMSTTIAFGKVAENRWDVVKISQVFTGRQGFISGGGSTTITYDRYREYPSVAAADAGLDAYQPSSG